MRPPEYPLHWSTLIGSVLAAAACVVVWGVTGGGSSICLLHRDAIKDYRIIAAGLGWAMWSAASGYRPLPTIVSGHRA